MKGTIDAAVHSKREIYQSEGIIWTRTIVDLSETREFGRK